SGLAQIEASGSNGGIIINSSSTGASDYSRLIFTKLNASGNEGLIRYNTNDYHMAFWTNATEKGRFTSAGEFLIGTTTARNRLTVQGTVFSTPTLGTASGQAFFGEAAGYGMMLGTSGFGYGWIQQQRVDGTATSYPLILQPVGGSVYVNRTGAQNNGKLEVLADSGAQAIVAQVQTNGNSLFQGFASAGGPAVFQVTGNGDGYLSGVLGVGMSPNLTQLEVKQNTTYAFGINNSGGTRNYSWRIDSSASDALVLGTRTSSTDLLWVTTGGKLLVGASSGTSELLRVNGSVRYGSNDGALNYNRLGWYYSMVNDTSVPANRYLHLKTNISTSIDLFFTIRAWGNHYGNAQTIASMWVGYCYAGPNSLIAVAVTNNGSMAYANNAYKSSDGYVVLVCDVSTYSYYIYATFDATQYAYAADWQVTNTARSSSNTGAF
ncbi:MAG: hypothetical protein EBU84_19950, partial [Actinobacteria bacterium]|nr:hypothetical protein [Actinomycetota bacterium]